MSNCCRLAALLLLLCSAPAQAQSLGEIAKKIEEDRARGGAAGVVFDERDMDPALARRDLLAVRLNQADWRRFLEADGRVAQAVAADPGIFLRLAGLNYTSLRSVGRFFQREPAIARVLGASGMDPHDYASAYLATKLALSSRPESSEPIVLQNAAFLKPRAQQLASLAIPLDRLSLHLLRARVPASVPSAAIVAPASRAPSSGLPRAAAAAANESGPIDMSEGAQIPDFEFVDFEGRSRRLSDFRGRYVMLDFWGSWCPPCRAEVPFVKDAYARFGSRGFEVLGMDSERDATVDQVRDYLVKNGVKWTFATPDSIRTLIDQRFQIPSFPRVILLDPSGQVIESRNDALRGENLALTLDRLLPR